MPQSKIHLFSLTFQKISPFRGSYKFGLECSQDIFFCSLQYFKCQLYNYSIFPGSPFLCEVYDPNAVRVDGDGINQPVPASVSVSFTIHMPVSAAAVKEGGFQVRITSKLPRALCFQI